MKRTVTDSIILGAIFKKDLLIYGRNKLYLFLTVFGLVMFVALFYVVPDTVEEHITLAIAPPIDELFAEGKEALRAIGFPEELIAQFEQIDFSEEEEGIKLIQLTDETQLRSVVKGSLEIYEMADGRLSIYDPDSDQKKPTGVSKVNVTTGIYFPPSFIADMVTGQKTTVTIFSDAAVPEEIRNAMQSFVREIAYQISGYELPVELPDEETVILGKDRLGEQVSLRVKMRPMLAFFMLMMETFAMASLISIEVLQRTVTALMVTPMRIWHFLTAKTVIGTLMAFSQVVIILVLVGAFTAANWSLLLVTALIGSILFTAIAMFVGAAGKDFIGQLMYAMILLVPLMIPSFAVLFPGTVASWVQVIPSYPIVELLVNITIYEAGWADSYRSLLFALLWVAILYSISLVVLKRKVESL